jgi:hypothetical protein
VIRVRQRCKFPALIRLGPSRGGGPASVRGGQMQRGVAQGQHHETHDQVLQSPAPD